MVAIILGIIVFVIGGAIAGTVTTMGAISGAIASGAAAPVSGTVHLGNGASIDLDKLAAAGQQAASQIKAQQQGGPNKVAAIDPERLKALLPDTVAGAARTDVSATSAGAAGFAASNAEATYQNGNARVTLKITDLAAAGGFAAMAGAINVQSDETTATGYKKVHTVNGMLTTERYDNSEQERRVQRHRRQPFRDRGRRRRRHHGCAQGGGGRGGHRPRRGARAWVGR